jgi:small subunit ribosomal protein S7
MIQQQTKLKEIYKKSETKKIKSVTTIKNYNNQNRLHKKVDKTTGTLDCLKTSIFNQLMLNGNKQTSEKLLLKSLKKLQKEDIKKKSDELIKMGLIKSSPSLFLKQIKRKRKRTIEFPFLLTTNARISYGIKFIVNSCKMKTSKAFWENLNVELVNSSKNISQSTNKKNDVHKEAFLKRKFANYRWF